jgi:hypothetical protein
MKKIPTDGFHFIGNDKGRIEKSVLVGIFANKQFLLDL